MLILPPGYEMSNQSPTANSDGQGPATPFDREQDKDWSPTQDESGTTDIATHKEDEDRQKRGNRGPDEQKGFGQGA